MKIKDKFGFALISTNAACLLVAALFWFAFGSFPWFVIANVFAIYLLWEGTFK